MFLELRDYGVDKLIRAEQGSTTQSYEVASKESRNFANSINSVSLRELFQLPVEVRTLFVQAATLSAEALSSSASFNNDVKALSTSQPPKTPVHLDLQAQAVSSKILATLCLIWGQTIDPALRQSLARDNSGQCAHITGLLGLIAPSLLVISANTLLAKLARDCHLHDHSRRLDQVCAAVKSPMSFAHGKYFKGQDDALVSHIIQQTVRILPILRAGLLLRQNEDVLVEMSRFAASIPDDKVLPLDQRKEMFKYENMLVLKLSEHASPYNFACKVGPHTRDLEFIAVPSNPATHQKPNTICVAPTGEVTFEEILNLMPVTDEDFRRMFPETTELHSMSETIRRVAGHTLFILKSMQEAAPTLLCRVQELPKYLGLEWLDEKLLLTVSRTHLGEFLKLFEYDKDTYDKLAKTTQYDPSEKPSHPPLMMSFAMQAEGATETAVEQEPDSETNSIVVVSDQEAALRREVSKLLHDKVKTFADLLPILAHHFDVEDTTQGKGDHRMAVRAGFRFTLAPEYRDPSAPLHIPITNKLLNCLRIPRAELKNILEQM
jgi:hypothetical protein